MSKKSSHLLVNTCWLSIVLWFPPVTSVCSSCTPSWYYSLSLVFFIPSCLLVSYLLTPQPWGYSAEVNVLTTLFFFNLWFQNGPRIFLLSPTLATNSLFFGVSIPLIYSILRHTHVSNVSNLLSSSSLIIHVYALYNVTLKTMHFANLFYSS